VQADDDRHGVAALPDGKGPDVGQVLFVEEHAGVLRVDALVDGPVSARAHLPGGVLGTIVRRRLQDWADEAAVVEWEVLRRHGGKLRLRDDRTTVLLDLVA